jgi:diguanylate cyclase (GGDEF)-like protein/putative nucleotidyltransferase with HDIG domain
MPLLHARSRTLITVAALGLVAVGGFTISTSLHNASVQHEREHQAAVASAAIRSGLANGGSATESLSGLFSIAPDGDRFAAYAASALRSHAVSMLGWAPIVPQTERASFEAQHGFQISAITTRGTRRAAPATASHYPLTFVAPLTTTATNAVGLDLASIPSVAAVLADAARSGRTETTPLVRLGASLPLVVIVAPAYQRGLSLANSQQRLIALSGFAVGTLDPAAFITTMLGHSIADIAISVTYNGSRLYQHGSLDGAATSTVASLGRVWAVRVTSQDDLTSAILPWVILAGGGLVALLVGVLMWQTATRKEWAEALVAKRTEELRVALAELALLNHDLDASRAEAERFSQTDPATGALNRPRFISVLEEEASRARREQKRPGVMLLAVDELGRLIDTYGAAAGEDAMREVHRRLKTILRPYDQVGRWAPAQFAIVTPHVPDAGVLYKIADLLRQAISSTPIPVGQSYAAVTASVGGALLDNDASHSDALVDADSALTRARQAGRNTTAVRGIAVQADSRSVEITEALRLAESLARGVAVREGLATHHGRDIAELAAKTADKLGLDADSQMRCQLAGLLHDVGKAALPDALLTKPGALSDDEWKLMRDHAGIGADMVAAYPSLRDAADAIRHHHERFDGTGYPAGLAGPDIPIEARIVAACDTLVAVESDRAFRRSRTHDQALDEVMRVAGTQLDPAVVDALVSVVTSERQALAAAAAATSITPNQPPADRDA